VPRTPRARRLNDTPLCVWLAGWHRGGAGALDVGGGATQGREAGHALLAQQRPEVVVMVAMMTTATYDGDEDEYDGDDDGAASADARGKIKNMLLVK
jgi:hypothetical protein